ncbi:ABC transporter substrate-binding protein [Cryobacterium sp. M15]|uniref:ABC transporter substrate-binding protein n=1 Tax=Cryobacterium sp. M15 TaxID=2048291 RepID=UPI000CE366BC|nr:ABC transporter substrate-binding protein [Cryobacterium sp. M15]
MRISRERIQGTPRPALRRVMLAVVVAGSLLVSGCAPGPADGSGEETIKLGSLHPLSGGLEFEGTEANQGVMVAVDEVNAAGGIASMGGAKVELLVEDNGGDVDRGSLMATGMVEDGVVAILGTMSSGVALAIQPISERSQVPFMITAGADPELTNRGLKYTFRAHPDVGMSVDGAIAALKGISAASSTPIQRVAHLKLDISAYTAVSELLEKKLPDADMDLVSVVTAPLDATDFSTQVTQIKQSKPDVLVISALLAQSLEIVKTMNAQEFRPDFTVGIAAGFTHPGFSKALPELGENIGDVTYWYNARSDVWTKFKAEYVERFSTVPTTHAAQGYQSAMIVMDALERAGTTDGPALRQALANTSLEDHLLPQEGPIEFGEDGQNHDVQSPMTQLFTGLPEITFPAEFAATDSLFPDPLATQ